MGGPQFLRIANQPFVNPTGARERVAYPYMPSLNTLSCRVSHQASLLPSTLLDIITPLNLVSWATELSAYPDKQFKHYILSGIEYGFRVGYDYANHTLVARGRNMSSALEHPEVVDNYLAAEKSLGRVGVVPKGSAAEKACHVSPFGVIPKKSKPGKWRLIVSIDQVVDCILHVGQGAVLAKVYIQQAYRNVPVHPDDRHLLGMSWNGDLLIDKVLPFGLRSAPCNNLLSGRRCTAMGHLAKRGRPSVSLLG